MEGLILSADSGGLSMTGEQLRCLGQDKDAFRQRLYQLCELRWGVGASRAAGEDGVAYQPTIPGQSQADATGRVAGEVIYSHTAAAKRHNLAIVQLKIGWHRQ